MQEWKELIPNAAWVVENLLTARECEGLIAQAQAEGIEQKQCSGDTRHRQRVTVRMEIPEISELIWERVKDRIPQEVVVTNENFDVMRTLFNNPDRPRDYIGRWKPSRMISRVNVAYCSGRGHLAAHRDADHVLCENERSFLTINGFLTDRPRESGGATRFLKDDIRVSGADIIIRDEDVIHRVESDKHGRSVVFFHGLMHDGEPLAEGSPAKYIFRALIYYQRDPESAPRLSDQQREAMEMYRQAVSAEESGNITTAIGLYKRAFRLDPSLE